MTNRDWMLRQRIRADLKLALKLLDQYEQGDPSSLKELNAAMKLILEACDELSGENRNVMHKGWIGDVIIILSVALISYLCGAMALSLLSQSP